jgi:hypothetical protein
MTWTVAALSYCFALSLKFNEFAESHDKRCLRLLLDAPVPDSFAGGTGITLVVSATKAHVRSIAKNDNGFLWPV